MNLFTSESRTCILMPTHHKSFSAIAGYRQQLCRNLLLRTWFRAPKSKKTGKSYLNR